MAVERTWGVAAGVAWRDSLAAQAAVLQAAADPRQAERAADLRDLQQQVLWALAGRRPDAPAPPSGSPIPTPPSVTLGAPRPSNSWNKPE